MVSRIAEGLNSNVAKPAEQGAEISATPTVTVVAIVTPGNDRVESAHGV